MADINPAGVSIEHSNSYIEESQEDSSKRLFSQTEVDELIEKHEIMICQEYDSIINTMRQQLSNLSQTLLQEESEKSKREESIALYVKEAHLCPFNCFKDTDLKVSERSRISSLPALSGPSTVAPTSQINFISDKHLKTSLILQKRLENAEKELIKAKQMSGKPENKFQPQQNRNFQDISLLQQIIERNFEGISRSADASAGTDISNQNQGEICFEQYAKSFEEALQKQREEKDILLKRIQELEDSLESAKGAEVEMNEQLIEKVAQAEIALNENKLETIRLVESAILKQKKEFDLSSLLTLLHVEVNSVKSRSFSEQMEVAKEKIKGLISQNNTEKLRESPMKESINKEVWSPESIDDPELKEIIQIVDMKILKQKFVTTFLKMKEDKEYAEKTAIDTKLELAETAMSRDYYEHNFVKLLKRVK